MAPELSILMPVYNEAATVEQAIDEAVNTDLPVDFELIVVDDGSTDGSREILERGDWPDGVRVLHYDANQGKGAAVRTAPAHAQGRFSAVFEPTSSTTPRTSPTCSGRCATAGPARLSASAPSTATPATRSCTCWGTGA
jgi:hypothetical protein